MENISRITLIETVDTAIKYSAKLEKNYSSVLEAEQQVNETAEESLAEVDAAFDELTKSVLDALNKRRETLKTSISHIREEGLAPLKACQEVIQSTLKNTQSYTCEGYQLISLCDENKMDFDRCRKFLDQSSLLGNLPAVPNMEEVPAVTVQLNMESLRSSLVSSILSAGEVSKMGPVQITTVLEKPGALLVQWEEVVDRGVDDHVYLLQLAAGNHPTPVARRSEAVYRDVYKGPDTSCVVRDLRPGAPYTLRVCGQGEHGQWGAWSLPRLAATHQPAFRWSNTNPHYSTSVEGKIATKLDKTVSLLSSAEKQFGPQHSIEFTVLECPDNRQPCEGLGVTDVLEDSDTLAQRGCLSLSANGCIFVDGVEKTTRLPALARGSRVTFTCEPLTGDRVRLQVDSGDKAVTYDWRVSSVTLGFVALCAQPGWKLMVE